MEHGMSLLEMNITYTMKKYYNYKVRPIRAFGNWTMGCMESEACNYNPEANMADGSCEYPEENYDCNGFVNAEIGTVMEGGYLFYIDSTGQHGLIAADEELYGNGAYSFGYLFDSPDLIQDISMFNLNGYSDWYLPSKTNLYSIFSLVNGFTDYPYSTNHTYYISSDDYIVHYNYNSSQNNLGGPVIEDGFPDSPSTYYRVIPIRSF